MSNEPAGYDDPISDEAADLLGRAGFARELAVLAISGPAGWSSRIGVYGEWGQGKTSVLRLARNLLEGDGHFVVDFNPWGCASAPEMVELLAKEILKVGKREDLPVPGKARRVLKWGANAVGTLAAKADGVPLPGPVAVAGPAVTATARVSPWLKRWAKDRKKDIEEVLELLSTDRRLIVFVDDVDRLDPKLLPGLMFALHEAFALPGITFVVALDPKVVGSALHAYHPGFGDGLAFLEKIVQFARWLPPMSESQRLRIAEADRQRHAPFLDAEILDLNQGLLPKNPREVRMLVRGLMPLARAFSRHDPDELDQSLVLLLECLRQRFPRTLAAMLENEQLLDSCPGAFIRDDSGDKFLLGVQQLARRLGEVPTDESDELSVRLVDLARAFCGRSIFWNAENIRYHAQLTDRPHAVTWREFRPLLETPLRDAGELDAWVTGHAQRGGFAVDDVVLQLFKCLLRSHNTAMEASADEASAKGQAAMNERAATVTAATRMLWFSSRYAQLVRTATNFKLVLQTFRRWAHFTLNDNDRAARVREREFLLEITRAFTAPIQLLEQLAPWEPNDRNEHAGELTDALEVVLLDRAAPDVMALFGRQSGIASALRAEQIARRYVLGLPSTWNRDRQQQLEELANSHPEVVAENLRVFLEVLVSDEGLRPGAREILNDRPLVELLWSLLSAVRWQVRFFRGIEKLRRTMERAGALPDPPWWADVQARANPPKREAKPEVDTPGNLSG